MMKQKLVPAIAALLATSTGAADGSAPTPLIREMPYRPDSRPQAVLKKTNGAYQVRLGENDSTFAKWQLTYQLNDDVTACRFAVRHDAPETVVRAGLLTVRAAWLDAEGKNLRSAYLEADSPTSFSRSLPRPKGARFAELHLGVRYLPGRTITFRDAQCVAVTLPERRVRIIVAKCTPRPEGLATCEDNQKRMESVFDAIAADGEKPDLVVFPETLLTRWVPDLGTDMGAQPIPGPHTQWASAFARKLHTNVVVSLREKTNGRYYNSAVVIDRAGSIVGVYRKTQLTVGEYESGYDWGDNLPVFDLDFGKVGVLICWDLWFPEAIRALRLKGAEIIAYPIAETSVEHFDWMWKTRAMENGIYLAAAISGKSGRCPSRIVSPAGEVLAETWQEQTYAATTIDLRDPPVNLPWLSVSDGEGETRTFYIHERHPQLYQELTVPEVESASERP